MKKLLAALVVATATMTGFQAQAAELKDGEQYITLNQERAAQPEVIEFFSFYCPHCYSFEMQYKIPAKVKEGLPKGTTFKQYHVDYLGPQGENLTRAWALAMALGVEDKVKTALFDGAQANAFKSMDDIRQKFIDNGVTAEQFDGNINSFPVDALVKKQQNLVEQFHVDKTPSFYVNGKFLVNNEFFENRGSPVSDYIKTVSELLNKD